MQLSQTDPTDGIVEASQPWHRRSVPNLTCKARLFHTTQRRYRQSVHALSQIAPTVGNLPAIILRTHRMVSPKRPERSDQPEARLTNHTTPSPAWCRRSVPRDWPTHVRMTLARPEDQGVTGVSRDRQRPPQSLLECAAPSRSSQCGTREILGFPITHNKDGPSWSVRHLAAPRSVGPTLSTKTTPPVSSADQ